MKNQKTKKLFLTLLILHSLTPCSPGCLSCTPPNRCSLCDSLQNYTLNSSSQCEKSSLQNCLYPNIQENCLLCSQTHYPDKITGKCIEIEEDKKLNNCIEQNENSCVKCEPGFYFGTISCEAVERVVEYCAVYRDKDTCLECGDGRVLDLEFSMCLEVQIDYGECAQYGFLDCGKCKEGFSLNFSLYVLDIKDTDFVGKSQRLLRDFEQGRMNSEYYPVCQANNIENCVFYENSKSCQECKEDFFVNSDNGCTAFPSDIISDCEKYNSPSSCKECKDGFHVNNLNQCVENEYYPDCDVYDKSSLSTICLKCTNDYYKFSPTKCIERSNKVINNCAVYNLISDQCKTCIKEFTTTSDGLNCLEVIENCKSYETSNVSTVKLVCVVCDNEYFLNEESVCEKGITNDCEIYETRSNDCVKCINNSFLNSQKNCVKHKVVLSCTKYSLTEENVCEICDNKTILFKVEKMCKPAEIITGCDTYLSEDECNVCKEKYFKSIKICVPIDEELNCLIMSDQNCTKCNPNYLIESGKCIQSVVYLEENCSVSNSPTGEETRNTLKCDYCAENSIPIYYTDYFLCHSNEWIEEIIGNSLNTSQCLQIDKIGDDYKCRICDHPYLNNDGVCLDGCDAGDPISLFEIEKDSDNFFNIGKIHYCGSTQKVSNCIQFSPMVFSQTGIFVNKCVKCDENYLSVIDKIEVGNFKDTVPLKNIDLNVNNGFLENPISFYPVTKQCKHNSDGSITFLENCEYYGVVSGNFKCFKCNHGRTGIVEDNGGGNFITSCPDSECSNTFVHGLSVELNSILSCHLCSNGKIPYLFGTGGTTFTTITDIKSYDLTNTTPGELSDPISGGKTVGCYLKNDPILNIRNLNLHTNCAIAFFNVKSDVQTITTPNEIIEDPLLDPIVDKFLSAEDSNKKFEVNLTKIAAFCIACERGKRPIKATSDLESEASPTYIPYMVADCEDIPNCQNSTWFNYCSQCSEGHIYEYIADFGVNYASCVNFSEDPNCFSAEKKGNFFSCEICNNGYYKNSDDICEILNPPKCEHFEREIKFKDYDINTFLFLNPLGKGCSRCKSGFKALKIEQEVKSCTFSNYISRPVLPLGTKYIFKCQKYFIEGTTLKCKFCANGYVVSSNDLECFEDNELSHCEKALTVSKCYLCVSSHITVDGKCDKKELPNCMTYEEDNFLTKQKCLECENKYYLKDGKCLKGTIENCTAYNDDPNQCKYCDDGYTRVNDKNGMPYCFEYDARVNCKNLEKSKFLKGIFYCNECKDSEPLFPTTEDIDKNFCTTFSQIEKCLEYDIKLLFNDSAFGCKKCEPDYFSTLETCELRENKDLNCTEFETFEDLCTSCADQYYVSPNKKTCLPNPIGVPGCKKYISEKECITCKSKMYLSENKCIETSQSSEIPNCLYYQDQKTCSQCRTGYLIENKLCKQAIAKNCLSYESIKQCATCTKDKGLKPEEDDIINCVQNTDDKCVEFNQTVYPFFCFVCIQGFYADEKGNCAKASVDIENCVVYLDKDSCSECEIGFILNPDLKSCVNNIYTSSFLDSNCENTIWKSLPFCKVCKAGFIMNLEKGCDPCQVSGCFLCDPFLSDVCYLCKSGFYMNEEMKCVSSEEEEVVVVEEFVRVLGIYGGLMLLFL